MLDPLFNPSSIALVGASNNTHKSGGGWLQSLIDYKYQGRIYPVNPGSSEIMGLKSYANVLDVPDEIDLAILTIPSRLSLDAVKDCVAKGVRFVIVHAAGFGEIGPGGAAMEAEIVRAAREGGTRIVGPNCLGMYCPEARISTIMTNYTSGENIRESGRVAFISQSGWATESVIMEGLERGLRFSKLISIGNQCDLTMADYLEYLGNDPKTGIIMAYLEGVRDGRRFLSLAGEISRKKPIIIWKGGITASGAKAAVSHTGALAGSDPVVDAAFRQAGVIRADNIYELIDYAVAFNSSPHLPAGNRVGVLVEAGGGAVAAADSCEAAGLDIAPFSKEKHDELMEYLLGIGSPTPSAKNPVDLVWPPSDKMDKIITRCIEIMADECDAIMWITYFSQDLENFARSLQQVENRIKTPIIVVPALPTHYGREYGVFNKWGLPVISRPERAARTIAAMARFAARSLSDEPRINTPTPKGEGS